MRIVDAETLAPVHTIPAIRKMADGQIPSRTLGLVDAPGNLIVFALMDTGAYFISMLSNFCSFPKPAAIMIEDGQHELIRRREVFSDLFNKDVVFTP